MTIARHCLHVTDVAELAEFYSGTLGMRNFGTSAAPLLGYDRKRCLLELHGGAKNTTDASQSDFYWKIGLTLRDLDHAVHYLRRQGWPVSDPMQFGDIGYLCHLRDPQGFAIELLQQGFEGREKPSGEGHAIGGQANIAHITLRINDIAQARTYCEENLGLRLISVQPVPDYGFCLYFFSGDAEDPPDADLQAVGNREWLWARPYALLELQHVFDGRITPSVRAGDQAGFAGFALRKDRDTDLNYVSTTDLRTWC